MTYRLSHILPPLAIAALCALCATGCSRKSVGADEFVISTPSADPIVIEAFGGEAVSGPDTLKYRKRRGSRVKQVEQRYELTIDVAPLSVPAVTPVRITEPFTRSPVVAVLEREGEIENMGYDAAFVLMLLRQVKGESTEFSGRGTLKIALIPASKVVKLKEDPKPISNTLEIPIVVEGTSQQDTAAAPATRATASRDLDTQIQQARELKEAGDLTRAAAVLEDVLTTHPDSAEAHHILAWVFAAMENKSAAKIHFQRVVDLAPESAAGREANEALARLD